MDIEQTYTKAYTWTLQSKASRELSSPQPSWHSQDCRLAGSACTPSGTPHSGLKLWPLWYAKDPRIQFAALSECNAARPILGTTRIYRKKQLLLTPAPNDTEHRLGLMGYAATLSRKTPLHRVRKPKALLVLPAESCVDTLQLLIPHPLSDGGAKSAVSHFSGKKSGLSLSVHQ